MCNVFSHIMSYPRNLFISKAKAEKHTEKYISECLQYIDKLDSLNLPVIFDVRHLAILLDIDIQKLYLLSNNLDGQYAYFTISKRNGGKRRIIAPFTPIRNVQLWIKQNILDVIEAPQCVYAFVKGRSIVSNAKAHENAKYIKKYDICNFFESISIHDVCKAFNLLGYDNKVSWILAKLCTTKIDQYKLDKLAEDKPDDALLFGELSTKVPFLVQGAPTSPGLSNLVCYRLDRRLQGLANKYGCCYSRYADDITFSSDTLKALPKDKTIERIIQSEGFVVNRSKTRLLKPGMRQMVTGLLIDNKVRVSSKYKRDINRHIHFCKKYGGKSHFARIAPNLAYGKEWLQGRIYFVYSVEPDAAKIMLAEFDKIDWMK